MNKSYTQIKDLYKNVSFDLSKHTKLCTLLQIISLRLIEKIRKSPKKVFVLQIWQNGTARAGREKTPLCAFALNTNLNLWEKGTNTVILRVQVKTHSSWEKGTGKRKFIPGGEAGVCAGPGRSRNK